MNLLLFGVDMFLLFFDDKNSVFCRALSDNIFSAQAAEVSNVRI